jgi:DNA-binding MarR family transcriptional regulator
MTQGRPLTARQRKVLQVLAGGRRPGDAAEALDVTPQRVSQIISRLVVLDLVVRHGERSYYVYLVTPEGHGALR